MLTLSKSQDLGDIVTSGQNRRKNGKWSMNKSRRVVRFALSSELHQQNAPRARFSPERGIEGQNVGVWLGLAAILWSLIALPALII
jgi:hypothetical protein